MRLSEREWSRLLRIHPRETATSPRRTDEGPPTELMRMYLEQALSEFVLTPAQRAVACRRLLGESIASIAMSRRTKPGTVRRQFGQILRRNDAADFEEFSSSVWKSALAAAAGHVELLLLP